VGWYRTKYRDKSESVARLLAWNLLI